MNLLKELDLSLYGIQYQDFEVVGDNLFIIKEEWNYHEALAFQEAAVDYIYQNKHESVYVFCSHNPCLTMGRGLQKRTKEDEALIEFDNGLRDSIDLEIFDISRGGGLTFHHPGQFVFYPIISLEHKKIKVLDYMQFMMASMKTVLEARGLSDVEHKRSLLGMWKDESKIASIGVCARRFVTFHGLALNLFINDSIKQSLSKLYPCGLPFSIYSSVSDYIKVDELTFREVASGMKDQLLSNWPSL